jgi:MoaA/NifB/PqqE/SkfB family radical SAM enzyme
MFKFNEIKILQLEISNYCNASCPQCPRNYFGGKTIPTLPLRKWNMADFKTIFTTDLLENLQQVYFCGTYGDPMTNKNIVEMCQFIKTINSNIKIGIHTNGGVGTTDTFSALAKYTDFIAFGIDGLQDTNHIYRRGTHWQKIIDNSQAYINNGGKAIWDFIVFEHNQHQVDDAKNMSMSLGFDSFNVKKTSRFFNRKHKLSDHQVVFDRNGQIDYTISIPTDAKYINEGYIEIKNLIQQSAMDQYIKDTEISCNAIRINEVYIGAEGFVFPCGWLHDRFYGPEVENTKDHSLIKELLVKAGGWTKANVFYTSLSDIVNGAWFSTIEESWASNNRLERCALLCGKNINVIGSQNKEIKYK